MVAENVRWLYRQGKEDGARDVALTAKTAIKGVAAGLLDKDTALSMIEVAELLNSNAE